MWRSTVRLALVLAVAAWAGGCSAASQNRAVEEKRSITQIEYYPFQVKGYQNTYPRRRILVLMPADDRGPDEKQSAGTAGENPMVGAVENQGAQVVERLFGDHPLAPTVQNALVKAAEEAGLDARSTTETDYQPKKDLGQDYVLASRISRCWVTKRSQPAGRYGPPWTATAEFALSVTIYKPPFSVPFFTGRSSAVFSDPQADNSASGIFDDVPIYQQPGEVLSVALTRAIAGVFDRSDLHELAVEDRTP
jgi:hypothetical protein